MRNQRALFDQLAREMGIEHLDQWYDISIKDIAPKIGGFLVQRYGNSLVRALLAVYPEHPWKVTRFSKVPSKFWHDKQNQRAFFDQVAAELGLKQLDDWYDVSPQEVLERGGRGLIIKHYNSSLINALRAVYPEHKWRVSKFKTVPRGFWRDLANQRQFFDEIASDLNITNNPEGWYQVSMEDIQARGGAGLLSLYYGNSISRALRAIYPEHEWDLLRFKFVPNGLWLEAQNRRLLFDKIARELGFDPVAQFERWYGVTLKDVYERGGVTVVSKYYDNSLVRALQAIYPEVPWDMTQFTRAPRGHWRSLENQRQFFDNLAVELGIKHFDDWYNVTVDEVFSRGGAGLLSNYYNSSLERALQAVYPEHPWQLTHFEKQPSGHWKSMDNQRAFFDKVGAELGVKHLDDWYNISAVQVYERSGRGLLTKYYKCSLSRALQTIYPEHPWQQWRFGRISSVMNSVDGNKDAEDQVLRDYLETMARELDIQHLDDWYRVSETQLKQRHQGGVTLLRRNGGLFLVLKRIYPQHPWDEKRFFKSSKKSGQRWMLLSIQKIFPDYEIIEEYLHPNVVFSDTKQPVELDVYLPSLSLAFEYHGEQHYRDLYLYGRHTNYTKQDNEKIAVCREAGITIIPVPYWWDRTPESLASTVLEARPDLESAIAPSIMQHRNSRQQKQQTPSNQKNK